MPRTKRDTYPTWQRVSTTKWRTAEQLEGEPDHVIEMRGRAFWVSWRTSAHLDGPYPSLAAAKQSVDDN
jgi:hypothetical protein